MSRVTNTILNWPENIKVTESVRNTKLDICKACPNYVQDESIEKGNCGLCGCDMLTFTWSKSMGMCPIGKFHGESL